MGKGTIISGGAGGLYQVQINFNRTRYNSQLARYSVLRASLVSALAAETDSRKKALIELQITSVDKAVAYLENNMPDDLTMPAWCADLSESLSGVVGLVEVPGEPTHIQIQPGYNDNAVYNAIRDGQVMPTISMEPTQAYYNLAMLPGWQKWKPLSRYGTITAITDDTADVDLDPETSSQQSLVINQEDSLSDVPIKYMDCNGVAFEVGDAVLILFTGQDWTVPKIVGFKDNPKPCGVFLVVSYAAYTGDKYCFIWDLDNDVMATGLKDDGTPAVFPCLYSEISKWFIGRSVETTSPITRSGIDVDTTENWYIDSNYTTTPVEDCCGASDCTQIDNVGGPYELLDDPLYSDRIYTWDFYQLTLNGYGGIVESRKEYTRENPTRAMDSFKLISLTSVSDEIDRETYAKYVSVENVLNEILTQVTCDTVDEWQTSTVESVELNLTPEVATALLPTKNLNYEKVNQSYDQSSGTLTKVLKVVNEHYMEVDGAYGTMYLVAYCTSRIVLKVDTYSDVVTFTTSFEFLENIEPIFVLGSHVTDAGLLNPFALPKHAAMSTAAAALKTYADTLAGASTVVQLGVMSFDTEILQ